MVKVVSFGGSSRVQDLRLWVYSLGSLVIFRSYAIGQPQGPRLGITFCTVCNADTTPCAVVYVLGFARNSGLHCDGLGYTRNARSQAMKSIATPSKIPQRPNVHFGKVY